MVRTITAAELIDGDVIIDDAASRRYGRTLELHVDTVVITAPSRMVIAVGRSGAYGIERQLAYGPDEAVRVRRSS